MFFRFSRFFIIWGLLLTGHLALAQNNTYKLSGTILHAQTRQPLPSITILKTSTRRGTVSDNKGQFVLLVKPNDSLLIRAVGFKPLQYVVHSQVQADLTVTILLEEGSQELPEIKIVGGLDYEKVNRALRNQKKPPAPSQVAKAPAPKPLFPEKKPAPPPPPTLENPASLLYDLLSKEGKDRRRLEEMLAEEAAKKKQIEDKKKKQAYDSLFQDRNRNFN